MAVAAETTHAAGKCRYPWRAGAALWLAGVACTPSVSPPHRGGVPAGFCPSSELGYAASSPLGISAADLVARFGNERSAARVDGDLRSKLDPVSTKPASQMRVSFAFAGGKVRYARCPTGPFPGQQLTFPVGVTLTRSDGHASKFEARLTATRADQVSLSGQSTATKTFVGIWMDADDIEILSGGPPPSSATRWSTLCNVDSEQWLGSLSAGLEQFPTPHREGRLDCVREGGGGVKSPAGALTAPSFALTRYASHACRRASRKDIIELPIEARPSLQDAWLGGTLRGSLTYDVRQGFGEIGLSGEIGPSATLKSLVASLGAPSAASFRWKIAFRRGAGGAEFADELLEITPTSVDVSIRCGALTRGP